MYQMIGTTTKFMTKAEEFEKQFNKLQDDFKDDIELYAANVLLKSGEVVPLLKYRILKEEKNANKAKK